MSIISIEEKIGIPKYKQIVNSIALAIENGALKKGDKLPSVSSIQSDHNISRDTVLTAINELKARGIVHSIPGKGTYILSEDTQISQKVFLLFDELNIFKEDLYNAFLNDLGDNIQVDIFFHHFNFQMFRKLIYDNIGAYTHYIIMPANLNNTQDVLEILPKDRVYILDQTHEELSEYPAIYQNFAKDMQQSLHKAIPLLQAYKKIILLFSEQKQPEGMRRGFLEFCKKNSIKNEIIGSLANRVPQQGEVYLIPDDRNLIQLLKLLKKEELILARDVGIIGYNDTLLKEIVEGGITTISTDFKEMGRQLAKMIDEKEPSNIENLNRLIVRNSL